MSFTSSQVWGTAESFGIRGKLTIKGTTHEVVFTARVEDTGLIRAETTLDRKDYGLGYGSTINDEVKLRLDIQLARVG
jgi:polyisoprenoid-binding protein YceI